MITYTTFVNQLALRGFHDKASLDLVWNHVHQHSAGSVDFSEFLSLMFLWGEVGDYDVILESSSNAEAVKQAFAALQSNWVSYDRDKNRKFDRDEFNDFLLDKLPNIMERSRRIIDVHFPPSQKGGISFPRFMHLLYCCFVELPQNVSAKQYVNIGVIKHILVQQRSERQLGSSACERSVVWQFLHKAFVVLEQDFAAFDAEGKGYVALSAVTMAVPFMAGVHQFDVLSRLESVYELSSLDRTEAIDFYEFLLLVFVMTRDGSYSHVVGNSQDHRQVLLLRRTELRARCDRGED
jgi:hypothetical protein